MTVIRRLLAPLNGLLLGDEPAIVAWIVAAGINLAAHYQFHLNAKLQTYLAVVVAALVHWVIRSLVTPVAKQDRTSP